MILEFNQRQLHFKFIQITVKYCLELTQTQTCKERKVKVKDHTFDIIPVASEYQEIHIDSVKIKTCLIMMREWPIRCCQL